VPCGGVIRPSGEHFLLRLVISCLDIKNFDKRKGDQGRPSWFSPRPGKIFPVLEWDSVYI
jgi:hypothetical protein